MDEVTEHAAAGRLRAAVRATPARSDSVLSFSVAEETSIHVCTSPDGKRMSLSPLALLTCAGVRPLAAFAVERFSFPHSGSNADILGGFQ